MSKADAAIKARRTPEELFEETQLLLNEVVRNALRSWIRHPQANDVERFGQRMEILLLENDKQRLRDFRQEAELKTWLQQVVNHEVSRVLRQENRNVGIDDAPLERLIQPSIQEELLLQKEQAQLLEEALTELTPGEQKLIELVRRGWKAEKTARKLGIQVGTFYARKSEAMKKLRKLIEVRQKNSEGQ